MPNELEAPVDRCYVAARSDEVTREPPLIEQGRLTLTSDER